MTAVIHSVVFLTLNFNILNINSEPTPIRIFPGTHFIPIKPITIYDASLPLTYVFSMDQSNDSFTFPTPFPPCLFNRSTGSLELMRAVQTLEGHLVNQLEHQQGEGGHRKKREIEMIGDFLHWCCSTATDAELHVLTSNEETVNKHLNNLQLIEKLDHDDLVQSSHKLQDFTRNISTILTSVHSTLDTFRHSLLSDSSNQEAVYNNLLSIFIRLYAILNRHTYLSKLSEVSSYCRQNLLPPSIIPPSTLTPDLLNLNTKIIPMHHTLAIPLSDIHTYYSIPIVNCISSPTKTIFNVRVPIKQTNTSWSLYKFLPTPLAWKNQTCHLLDEKIILAKSGNLFRTLSGSQLDSCDPKGLCYLPRQLGASSLTQTCAELLFRVARLDTLMSHCDFTCFPKPSRTIVTTINPTSFVLTHPTKFLSLSCLNTTESTLPKIPSDVLGALQLTLPCSCQLSENSTILISRSFPCTSQSLPNIYHIIPSTWSNLHSLHMSPTTADHLDFYGLNTILNPNWTLNTPSFQIQTHIAPESFDPVSLPVSWSDVTSRSHILLLLILFIWNLILSIAILYLFIKRYIANLQYSRREPSNPI